MAFFFGIPFSNSRETAEDLMIEELEEISEPRWQEGGFRFLITFEDLVVNESTNEKVSEYLRNKTRKSVDDPDWQRNSSQMTTIT